MNKSKVSESQFFLIENMRKVIQQTTQLAPMPIEDIIIALGFVTGVAIVNGTLGIANYSQLREMALNNIDMGINTARQGNGAPGVILPGAAVH
mgnify:CR=1 FL=1